AATSENNGEISMSVEETNRIRALIGLRPLVTGLGKEAQAVENMRRKNEEDASQREAADVAARLEAARRRRQLHERLEGHTLGAAGPGEEAVLSAAEWVNRGREKAAAAAEERRLEAL
ncbi:unnamed protein product, partial [Phaeothamnion confervicola]